MLLWNSVRQRCMCDDNHRSTGRIFQQVKYQIYCRVKSLVAYIRGLAGIFSCSCIHIYSSTLLGYVLPRDSRGTTSRPFIFIGLLSSRLFKKAGEKKYAVKKTTWEIWSFFDNMHLIRSALCGSGGLKWKPERKDTGSDTKLRQTRRGGRKCRAERDLNFL